MGPKCEVGLCCTIVAHCYDFSPYAKVILDCTGETTTM